MISAHHRGDRVRAFAPGRVNLIGDHTDYTGGIALPMAIELGTTVEGQVLPDDPRVRLTSTTQAFAVDLPIVIVDPTVVDPPWGRYVAGVVQEVQPPHGFEGTVSTTLPIGSGLSSSASLELAVALALGFDGTPRDLAALGQRAEQQASGVPCGIMDQLASACGIPGHALLINFTTLSAKPTAIPPDAEIVVVHSGEHRELAGSAYADRRIACERAAALIGPLLDATPADVGEIRDPMIRARARHVVSENSRVRDFASALADDDLPRAGKLMVASHRSLATDFQVSTPGLDALVRRLVATPGVFGARLTGAGFGGCVVALTRPGTLTEGWVVRPSGGATRTNL